MNVFLIAVGFILLGVLFVVAPYLKKLAQNGQSEEELPFKLKDNFFTHSEWEFFRILEEQIDHSKFTIFPKVRLGDFVEVDAPKGERMGHWNKIKSKHIDYLIWDTQKNSFAVAIELDGKSHNSERMQKSDSFKDNLYPTIGLELVRVKVGSDFVQEITKILQKLN